MRFGASISDGLPATAGHAECLRGTGNNPDSAADSTTYVDWPFCWPYDIVLLSSIFAGLGFWDLEEK
jgi:hypothetical protein